MDERVDERRMRDTAYPGTAPKSVLELIQREMPGEGARHRAPGHRDRWQTKADEVGQAIYDRLEAVMVEEAQKAYDRGLCAHQIAAGIVNVHERLAQTNQRIFGLLSGDALAAALRRLGR